MGMGVNL